MGGHDGSGVDNQVGAIPSSAPTSRRRLLRLAGLGGAAAVAALLPREDALAGHDGTNIMHLGETNLVPADMVTAIEASVGDYPRSGLSVTNGFAEGGWHAAVRGADPTGSGLAGESVSGRGVAAGCDSGPALMAESNTGAGVWALSPYGVGVVGMGSMMLGEGQVPQVAPGVLGIAPGAAAAVRCVSGGLGESSTSVPVPDPDGGLALDVVGQARFSNAGSGAIAAGASSASVANASVSASSHVTVTLTGDPGNRQVQWVELDPGAGFTVHLTAAPAQKRPATTFTYLVVQAAP
jgi:hypothetical protein